MVNVLGIDIGGANTKYVLLNENKIVLKNGSDYLPLWQKKDHLNQHLQKIKSNLIEKFGQIDYVVFVTTAELADCFETKEEGIEEISKVVLNIFDNCKVEPAVYSVNDYFVPASKAKNYWLEVAASNWAVSAKYLGFFYPYAILIDIGSTTTDIIPIINQKVVTEGKDDLERLMNHELLYTGLLRTNLATVVSEIRIRGKKVPVASELFATTGDIYLVLGDIKESDFTVDTANRKPAKIKFSLARIAKVVCSDMIQLSINDILEMALQIKKTQKKQISEKIKLKYNWYHKRTKKNPKIILAGIGAKVIGNEIMKELKIKNYILLNEVLTEEISSLLPAFAVACNFVSTQIIVEKGDNNR